MLDAVSNKYQEASMKSLWICTLVLFALVSVVAAERFSFKTYNNADCSDSGTGLGPYTVGDCVPLSTISMKALSCNFTANTITITSYSAASDCTGASNTGTTTLNACTSGQYIYQCSSAPSLLASTPIFACIFALAVAVVHTSLWNGA
eukprot:GILK01015589.1.p1 GENE.GILK01015589.1~~GILK01015589.1.p1  ORF type:complete len:148 (+),score=13.04 GILK01015589.1:22-465(+)